MQQGRYERTPRLVFLTEKCFRQICRSVNKEKYAQFQGVDITHREKIIGGPPGTFLTQNVLNRFLGV